MTLDEIQDAIIAATSNNSIERVDGLNALSVFLHDLQRPKIRWLVFAVAGDPVYKKMTAPHSGTIHSDSHIVNSNEISHYKSIHARKLQYLGFDGEWYDIPGHDITIKEQQ